MKQRGKTIQIYLPDGNPRSVKIAEFTSRTVQALLIPRSQLEEAAKRPELSNVGVYFLFGENVSGNSPLLYIGEAEDCCVRLKQHNRNKDWWNFAVVCVSKTAEFTKAHVKYLEWHAHDVATKISRYKLENGNTPPKPHISEPVEADLLDHFDTISVLVSTLGYPAFDQVNKPKQKELLHCKNKKAHATGEYIEDGFIVFKGSIANLEFTKSAHAFLKTTQESLIEDGTLERIDDKTLKFTKDHVFNSPSTAAGVVTACNANGWTVWKYESGKTLDEVKRKGFE